MSESEKLPALTNPKSSLELSVSPLSKKLDRELAYNDGGSKDTIGRLRPRQITSKDRFKSRV